mmetsp:Transcript_11521/g.21792  ORF Transcript_11521/g.21792 Transcript_11521/m.21792 type:complete len:341 (-) Transcript_11521:7-1029(-)
MSDKEDDLDDADEVWACLTRSDLEADLRESDDAVAAAGDNAMAGRSATELREALRSEVFAGEAIDTDIFVSRHGADQDMAAGLQKLYAEVEMLQFNVASMVAAVSHGPLSPPLALPPMSLVKAFGVEAQATLAALPALRLPSSASSFSEFQERLATLPACLTLQRSLHISAKKVDTRQDEKDINRDKLEVNGVEVHGAEGGYQAAVATIAKALQAGDVAASRPTWPSHLATRAAQGLLSALNRTTSGFMAFEEVLRFYDCPDIVVVSPESAAARPLEAAITGGVVLGRAHTRYAVHSADGAQRVATVDAFVVFRCSSSLLQEDEAEVPARILLYRLAESP